MLAMLGVEGRNGARPVDAHRERKGEGSNASADQGADRSHKSA